MSIFDDFRASFRQSNNGLMKIILINVVVFLVLVFARFVLWIANADGFYALLYKFLAIPSGFGELVWRPWTLLTYAFTHEGILHILFNMLFLYWFGRLIAEYLGTHRVVGLYIMGSLAGAAAYLMLYNLLPRLEGVQAHMVGASAGVYAIVVGAATLMPNFTFFLFILGPVRIKYIAAFYVLLSFIEITQVNSGGNAAHLGGALMGYLFITQLRKGRDWGAWVNKLISWFQRLFSPKPKMKVTYTKKTVKSSVSGNYRQGAAEEQQAIPNQEEIDRILDKISLSGYESLTKEEKQKLFDASR